MSKKLIAVAAAAALALTGLVGIAPATASVSAAYTSGNNVDASSKMYSTAALATAGTAAIDVPSNNVLEYTNTASRDSLLKVVVTASSGDAVEATVSAGKIVEGVLDSANEAQDTKDGASSYSKTATGNVTFYVYTTTTAVQSLTIKVNGNTSVVYFKADPGPEYNIASVTVPDTVVAGLTPSSDNLKVAITDVFGNNAGSGKTVTASVLGGGATVDGSATGSLSYDSDDKVYEGLIVATTTSSFALSVTITATDVDGLPDAVDSYFKTINSSDAAASVAALTAQVAALQAQLEASRPKAKSVTKKRYNTLARKWNAANPGSRVALKK
jgi:hypothetical protein